MPDAQRDRCYECFRPRSACFCLAVPTVDNDTHVLILQHIRERFHPFNTARLTRQGLRNATLLVDHTRHLAARLRLRPRAGLLYPGPGSRLITEVPAEQRPDQLVVLDGTWHHAKTLLREIAPLRALPRYRLAPAAPSRYRIRREPNTAFLSTVEATVAALQALEPATEGLERLLLTFNEMVERQLAHPKSSQGWRSKKQHRNCGNIPAALLDQRENIVVAYGESALPDPASLNPLPTPVYWVAERLGDGERFARAIQPQNGLPAALLGHFELTEEHFRHAVPLEEAGASWRDFLRDDDIVVVYSQGTARLLHRLCPAGRPCLVLKSVDLPERKRGGTLDQLVADRGVPVPPVRHPGRAGLRLANLIALVEHLHETGNTRTQPA
ncbi:MAG: tRNA-uridine aminocarboxypropyltransferase [Pirellulales bacterium]